jgi:hypothetical protein
MTGARRHRLAYARGSVLPLPLEMLPRAPEVLPLAPEHRTATVRERIREGPRPRKIAHAD